MSQEGGEVDRESRLSVIGAVFMSVSGERFAAQDDAIFASYFAF